MADRVCPVCGEPTGEPDRFCAACGMRLDAPIVLDGSAPPPDAATEHVRSSGRLASVVVPVLVLGVLTLGAFALFGTSGEGDGEQAADEAPAPTSSPSPSPSPEVEPTTRPTARPTPTSTPAPTPPGPGLAVDVSALPPTDATHLVVAKGDDVAFLDLATGVWTVQESSGGAFHQGSGPWAFADGVVMPAGDGVVYVPIDASPVILGRGWPIGVASDRVWIQDWAQSESAVIVAVNEQGETVDEFTPPPMSSVGAVLPNGALVIRGGGRLFLRSAEGDVRAVDGGDGDMFGVVDTRVLLTRCDDTLSCAFVIVDLVTNETTTLEPVTGWRSYAQLAPEGVVLYENDRVSLYRVEGSVMTFDRELSFEEADRMLYGATTRATDPSGLTAVINAGSVLFEDSAGVVLADAPVSFLNRFAELGNGFSEAAVLFITVDQVS